MLPYFLLFRHGLSFPFVSVLGSHGLRDLLAEGQMSRRQPAGQAEATLGGQTYPAPAPCPRHARYSRGTCGSVEKMKPAPKQKHLLQI